MKSATHIKFNFTFDYYVAVVSTDAGGNAVVEYVKSRSDNGFLAGAGREASLVTVKPLDVGSVVRNLSDRDGNAVFSVDGESYDMYVTSAEPQFDTFSRIIGWRQRLSRTLPVDQAAIFNDLGAALVRGL